MASPSASASMSVSAYTAAQIKEYFEYINLPEQYRQYSFPQHTPHAHAGTTPTESSPPAPATRSNPISSLQFLSILHVHQISTIPYENLSLHYSTTKRVCIDPQYIFDKFIHHRRGGYCLEANVFYAHVLRALGFRIYSAGVRIRLRKDGIPHGEFVGWHHMVNVVRLEDGREYMVDVGFGGDGPIKPLLLCRDVGVDGNCVSDETRNLGPQTVRLVNEAVPGLSDETKKWWIYQYRNSPNGVWNSYYAFPEVEFSTHDFDIMNFWLVNHPESFQRLMVLIVAFVREGTEIIGKLMLIDGKVKQNMGGKTEVVQILRTEAERKDALKNWFGLVLTEEEYQGIRGHCTELRKTK